MGRERNNTGEAGPPLRAAHSVEVAANVRVDPDCKLERAARAGPGLDPDARGGWEGEELDREHSLGSTKPGDHICHGYVAEVDNRAPIEFRKGADQGLRLPGAVHGARDTDICLVPENDVTEHLARTPLSAGQLGFGPAF